MAVDSPNQRESNPKNDPHPQWTTGNIIAAMREKFPLADGYALIHEVGNATGAQCRRHADAVLMNLWPSRGLEIQGFEYKSSRSDWRKELDTPGKADPVFKYCDKWWLVVGSSSIVKDGELPKGWGLMAPRAAGEVDGKPTFKLQAVVQPARLEPAEAITPSFIAALLRAALKESPGEKMLEAVRAQAMQQGIAQEQKRKKYHDSASTQSTESKELEALKLIVAKFEERSGLKIDGYFDAGPMGDAVNLVRELQRTGFGGMSHALRDLKNGSERLLGNVKWAEEQLDAILKGKPVTDPKEE